jgi:O-antigen/teichoic acid export membrane protein
LLSKQNNILITHLKNDVATKSMLSEARFVFTGKAINMVMTLATQSALAWFLGPSGRGEYGVCMVSMSILSIMFIVGGNSSIRYYTSAEDLSISDAFMLNLIYSGGLGFIAVCFGLVLIFLPFSFIEKTNISAIIIAILCIPIESIFLGLMAIFTSFNLVVKYSFFFSISGFIKFFLVFLFLFYFKLGVSGALFAHFLTFCIMVFIVTINIHKQYNLQLNFPKTQHLINHFQYGMRYYLGSLSALLNIRISTIFIAFFVTKESIGFFDTALTIISRIEMVPDSIAPVLITRIAKSKKDHQIFKIALLSALFCFIPLSLLYTFTNFFVIIVFSKSFLPMVPILKILIFGMTVRCFSKVFIPFFMGTNRPEIASLADLSCLLVNLFLLWILFPELGLIGAAIATTCSYFASSFILITSFWIVNRNINENSF